MIVIALGANQVSDVGSPSQTILAAIDMLAASGVRVDLVSRLFNSAAWPDPAEPPYVNAVARITTDMSPASLMALLHRIEHHFRRMRGKPNAPRTLDLDIIDFDGRVEPDAMDGPILPHPRAHQRPFVLAPLLDVAPEWVHPVLGQSAVTLLEAAETAENRATPLG